MVRFKFNIDEKLDPSKNLDKKVKLAIKNGHVINAVLVDTYISYDENNVRTYSGKYEYEINCQKRRYNALFWPEQHPPRVLHLYYEKTPQKLFTNEEYHYYAFTALPLVLLNLSPFLVGAFMVWILGLAG